MLMWSGVMVNLGIRFWSDHHLLLFHLVGEWFHGVFETLDSALHVVYVGDVGWVEAFFDQAFHLVSCRAQLDSHCFVLALEVADLQGQRM